MKIYIILICIGLLINIAKSKNGTRVSEAIHENYRRVFNKLVIGYDCSTPQDVTSHELDTLESCEEKLSQEASKPARLQIIQRSDKYVIKGRSCTLRRTRKLSHCGTSDHTVPYYQEEFTYKHVKVSTQECNKYLD